jgi:hypothetical protein
VRRRRASTRCCRFSVTFCFVLVIAVAAMMALAELGVETGPLIVGASVVGFAIAQRTLELIHPWRFERK